MAKATFSLLPPREIEEGRGGRRWCLAGGPGPWWQMGGGGKGAWRRGGSTPPGFRGRRPAGRGDMAAGGGRLWPAWWRCCRAWRRPELEGKGRGSQGGSIPYLGSGWGAARRGALRWPVSWRRRQWRWRRWELGEGARSDGGGHGGDELRGEPLYRRSRSVEEERGGGGGRRAQRGALMAFGRLRVSRSGARAARRSQGDGTARAGAVSGAGGAVLDGGRRGEQCHACCAWARTGAAGSECGARTWPCSLAVGGVRASR